MRELSFKHYFLFIISFAMLWWSDLPGGALLIYLVWQQMGIYLWKMNLTKKSQINNFLHSLTLMPLLFFLGAISAFVHIYLTEMNGLLLSLALALQFIMTYIFLFFGLSFFFDYDDKLSLIEVYKKNLLNLKLRKLFFLQITVFFILVFLVLQFLSPDYAIVASYVFAHIMGNKNPLKLESALKNLPKTSLET